MLLRLCAVFLAGMTAAGAQEAQPGRVVNLYSLEKEAALGKELAAEFSRTHTRLGSADALAFVERIGRQLAVHFPGGPAAWAFEVMSGNSNRLHEPHWFPGGYIFVPAGLFLAAQDEAEFVGMLAHAMAHVIERHATRMASKGQIAGLASIPLIFMGGWTGNADVLVPLSFLKFARGHELDADLLAAQAMAKAGYDPAALSRYIGRVQVDPPGQSRARSALPDRDARLASLANIIARLPARTYSSGDDFQGVREEVRGLTEKEKPDRPPTLRR